MVSWTRAAGLALTSAPGWGGALVRADPCLLCPQEAGQTHGHSGLRSLNQKGDPGLVSLDNLDLLLRVTVLD